MTIMKRSIINLSAVIVAVLFVIGAFNLHEVLPLVDYLNEHTSDNIRYLYYGMVGFTLFFFPLIAGVAVEEPLYRSGTRVGYEVSNSMTNARDSWLSFFAVGISGGIVTLCAAWGVVTLASL